MSHNDDYDDYELRGKPNDEFAGIFLVFVVMIPLGTYLVCHYL